MKKRFNLKNSIGKKNLLFTIVALVLVMLMVVGVSYSWIEQISNVEMQLGGVESPMHISTDVLNVPAEAKINTSDYSTAMPIDLSKYFYEGGNMHLSSCYSDSKTFYFPKKGNTGSSNVPNYRLGTKSDANVNYISVSFKIENKENYEQVYWFDKSTTFFSTGDNTLDKLIRCSMTVDGATSIFSASDTPTYKTVDGISDGSPETNSCQSFAAYQYDSDHMNQDDTNNTNLSPTRGANGNVLFTLPAKAKSTINIKVWLEYDNTNRSAYLSSINLKLATSFSKTRRINIVDNSIYSTSSSKWLRSDGAKLYLALIKEHKDSNDNLDYYVVEKKWQLQNSSNSTTYSATDTNFHADVESYYNNWKAVILRCSDSGYAQGNKEVEYNGKVVKYDNNGTMTIVQAWNDWDTSLPDTFDNRTFTEYTPEFGSWSSNVHHFYYIDSWYWNDDTQIYMWDNKTASGSAGSTTKVIENASYPGQRMYWASGLNTSYTNTDNETTSIVNGRVGADNSSNPRVYTVFYDTDYTNVIFNKKDSSYKTGDLWIPSDIDDHEYYYDLRSGRWIADDLTKICYTGTHYYTFGKKYADSGSNADDEHFYRCDDDGNKVVYATKFLNAGDIYVFQIHSTTGSNWYKPSSTKHYLTSDSPDSTDIIQSTKVSVSKDNGNYFINLEGKSSGSGVTVSGIYTIRYNSEKDEVRILFPVQVPPGTDSPSSSSSGSGGSSSGSYYMWYNTNNSTYLNAATSAGQMTALGNGSYYSSFTCANSNFDIIINNSSTKGSILNSSTTVTHSVKWAKIEDNSGVVYWVVGYYQVPATTIYVVYNPTANSVDVTRTNPAG